MVVLVKSVCSDFGKLKNVSFEISCDFGHFKVCFYVLERCISSLGSSTLFI